MIFRWLHRDRGHLSREELSTYVDGGPGAPSEARVEAHLAACDTSCAAELADLRATVAILRSIAPVEPPRSFALTPEMIADLPDGRPLGSPPPMRDAARRGGLPVYAPAAAAIAAALVFALVLVGNLSGAIEQSGSTSSDAASAPVALSQAVERDTVLEVPAAAGAPAVDSAAVAPEAAPPQAASAAAPEIASIESESAITAESKAAPEIERVVTEDTEALPRATVVPESADELAAAAPSLASEPQLPAAESAPQPLPAGDGEAAAVEQFESSKAAAAPELAPERAAERVTDQAVLTVPEGDDDFDLPVWQILLGAGLAAIALAIASLAAARRARRI